MKVKIGKYPNYIGPHEIAQTILFWIPKYKPDNFLDYNPTYEKYVDGFAEFLKKIPNFTKLCSWIFSKRKRVEKVKLDDFDTWNAYHTIALVTSPLLKQLKDEKQGSPFVDNEDVPWYLSSTFYDKDSDGEWDTYEKKWNWVMDEMIWAFEQIVNENDWESRYHHGTPTMNIVPVDVNEPDSPRKLYECVFNNNDSWTDYDGMKKHEDKIKNGLRLFAKYYYGLWD